MECSFSVSNEILDGRACDDVAADGVDDGESLRTGVDSEVGPEVDTEVGSEVGSEVGT